MKLACLSAMKRRQKTAFIEEEMFTPGHLYLLQATYRESKLCQLRMRWKTKLHPQWNRSVKGRTAAGGKIGVHKKPADCIADAVGQRHDSVKSCTLQ